MIDDHDSEKCGDDRNQVRRPFSSKVEFIANFDVMEAGGINISDGGVAFEVAQGLSFDMRLPDHSGDQVHQAELVWLKRRPDGSVRLGFKFTKKETEEF